MSSCEGVGGRNLVYRMHMRELAIYNHIVDEELKDAMESFRQTAAVAV